MAIRIKKSLLEQTYLKVIKTQLNKGFPLPKESIAVPVIAELLSEPRKRATSAISSGRINFGFSFIPEELKASLYPSVSVPPGQIAFTFMPC